MTPKPYKLAVIGKGKYSKTAAKGTDPIFAALLECGIELDLSKDFDKQLYEIFVAAFKMGAVFGYGTSKATKATMKQMIALLEEAHPTPKEAIVD